MPWNVVFTVPLFGEFSDVIWAPMAAYLMTRMYKGTAGKVGGVVTFIEEIVPLLILYLLYINVVLPLCYKRE
jgi:hypothetical protein